MGHTGWQRPTYTLLCAHSWFLPTCLYLSLFSLACSVWDAPALLPFDVIENLSHFSFTFVGIFLICFTYIWVGQDGLYLDRVAAWICWDNGERPGPVICAHGLYTVWLLSLFFLLFVFKKDEVGWGDLCVLLCFLLKLISQAHSNVFLACDKPSQKILKVHSATHLCTNCHNITHSALQDQGQDILDGLQWLEDQVYLEQVGIAHNYAAK